MLVYDSYKSINHGKKCSLYYRVNSLADASNENSTIVITCGVPRAFAVAGARMELYREGDMSTQRIRAEHCSFDEKFDFFRTRLMVSDICYALRTGVFFSTFMLNTPYGLLYTSSDGCVTHKREEIRLQRFKLDLRRSNGDNTQNVCYSIVQTSKNE